MLGWHSSLLDRPEQPQDVTAVGISSREINLTWVEPHDNNAPITGYQVMYMLPEFVVEEREVVVNTSVEIATISELFPGVNYTFTVTAFNEIDQSTPSDPVTVRTLDEGKTQHKLDTDFTTDPIAAPTSPPSNVMATAVSPTSIMVTWDMVPPIDQNGVITMYEVLYEPLEAFNGAIMSNTTTVDGTARAVNLTGLEEYVNYTISVRAYTSAGEGPYSDGVIELTNEDGKRL